MRRTIMAGKAFTESQQPQKVPVQDTPPKPPTVVRRRRPKSREYAGNGKGRRR